MRSLIVSQSQANKHVRPRFSLAGRQAMLSYALLTPAIIYFIVFFFFPIALELWASMRSGRPLVGASEYVGFANYSRALQDSRVQNSLLITLGFAFGSTFLTALVGLVLALILNQNLRGRIFLRAVIFFPYLITVVIVSLIWKNILDPYLGVFNGILTLLGIENQTWLVNPSMALLVVIFVVAWQNMGYTMTIFLAGLQGIPVEYYDAAAIDGADSWQRFWRITLPLLKPTTLFVTIIGLVGSLQAFAPALLLTNGGPAEATRLYAFHVYQVAFNENNIGYASSLSFLMFVLILVLTAIQFRLGGQQVEY
jgi:multiple sugar transport system permease protein